MSEQRFTNLIIKPEHLSVEPGEDSKRIATIIAEPLDRGFGLTLGNALRRVLLSSLPGAAITSIQIEGVLHEFSTMPGILEDVPEIVLNVRSINLRMQGQGPKRVWLRASGPGEVQAGEIQTDDDIDILNPELVVCTLETGARIAMEMTVERGKGYVPATANPPNKRLDGLISVDALFSPVRKVSYRVENTRVGRVADYERLALRVETNGAITPEEAVALGARILQDHLLLFATFDESPLGADNRKSKGPPLIETRKGPVAPHSADYIDDFARKIEEELLRNSDFGGRSRQEIKEVLDKIGLQLTVKTDTDESRAEQRSDLVASLNEGQILYGVVKYITNYGAFVDLGGIDGLLHVTEIAWRRINHPSEALHIGQNVKVQVIRFNPDTQRILLGMKQLEADPWEGVELKYPAGAKFRGRITNITDYGAFVELEPGVEGLVHVSEMSWTKKNVHPGKIVSINQEVEVIVLDVNPQERRLSLSLKQTLGNPWEAFLEEHPIGSELDGEVRDITELGLVVGLPGDIDGLVDLSDVDRNGRAEEPIHDYGKGQRVKVTVLDVDVEEQSIILKINGEVKGDRPALTKETDLFGELETARMFGHEAEQLAAIELQRPLGVRQPASNRLRALHEIFGTTTSAF